MVNEPNLDDGNLIPVYYDDTTEVWRKADSNNTDNSWYDYENKMWANAILINDSAKRSTYQSADVGTEITNSDITAFFVWIPRYKYRVWNITRQGGNESTYAYSAYSTGIEIEFENGIASTGNVECTYNTANTNSGSTLSDTCVYDETTTITASSDNTNFTDAWYTHPAFTFSDSEKTGFWIGKFETTVVNNTMLILPSYVASVDQNVSTLFTWARRFQNYGLSSDVNAHMLTNLEWGAMAYLTHSIYGLCDETSCRDAYINNSSDLYTGRSSGGLASNSSSSSYGTYDYKGYLIDSSTGSSTTNKDTSTVASTTGNITGVYDVVGGAEEYVMANQVSENNAFYPSYAGSSWSGSSTLSTFYYNAYSYSVDFLGNAAFNRSRLGDALGEVLGSGKDEEMDTWLPGVGITGAMSMFVYYDQVWFIRSSMYSDSTSSSFSSSCYDGDAYDSISFRVSIS